MYRIFFFRGEEVGLFLVKEVKVGFPESGTYCELKKRAKVNQVRNMCVGEFFQMGKHMQRSCYRKEHN